MTQQSCFTRILLLTAVTWLCCAVPAFSQKKDSTARRSDSLHFPLQDRRGDPFTWKNRNPFDLKDTSYLKRTIEYDPVTKQYYIIEKVGNQYFRKPTYLSFEEFWKLQSRQAEDDYFNQRANTLYDLNKKVARPRMQMYNKLFDRIFGADSNGLKIDIRPSGTVDLSLGYQGQNIKNPTLPENARRTGGLDFNMNANVQVIGNIGNKLKLPINYNTLANFDYENQLKLDYRGMDDEIIKSIEAGNISFQSKGTLVSSVQSLFGIKTQLQFGRLLITAALANQRSQKQSVALKGGGLTQTLNKKLDDYEENKHFLLAQYFRNNYNKTMSKLPVVNSQVQILRMEVWVTNRTGTATDARYVAGLMDLGEAHPYNPINTPTTTNELPQNGANTLYSYLVSNPNNRNPNFVNSLLQSRGLTPVNEYEKTFARKLNTTEYYFNPQVGFLSLNQQLQPDDVLGVAYQYTYNGRTYQVGEFSQDVTVDSTQGVQKVLFLKLLKATSQRTNLPIWDLMMKNVYSLDVNNLQQQDFKLNILYQDPSGGTKPYLPESAPAVQGKTLLNVLNLDRLNNRNDPLPDGVYDYVEGFTVLSQQGKIIFPVLEPFGRDLDSLAFQGQPQALKDKYVFYALYDSIKAIAQTHANLNRFVAQGTAKGSTTNEISLNAINVPPGSVTVTAGGQLLRENVDYVIDYSIGSLKIINQAILNSGVPVNVQYENNAGFGLQQRNFMGLRLDYKASSKLNIGATIEHLGERPFFTKMDIGDDPISNTIYGVDFNYRSEWPGLTRLLNKLPFYKSNAMSSINAYGEAAALKPGHASQIGKGNQGAVYIDDFEGTSTNIDLRYPFVNWTLASTPAGNGLFPEATLVDSLPYGKNRAKLAWYSIEPVLQDKNNANNPLRKDLDALSDPRTRAVFTNELFPQRTTNITDVQTSTFDLAYYPTEKGPYNFETATSELDANGRFRFPKRKWGGIMRSIDQTDFETANIAFVEFWMQDPFVLNQASTGGKLMIDLGNISEDILKDGRRFYENGLITPSQPAAVDSTGVWGVTPVNPIQITQAFSNDPAERPYQDVGFDGMNDAQERNKRSQYLSDLSVNFPQGSSVYQGALNDPSNDNYKWYRDASFDAANTGILGRYKSYNNPQGNSPVADQNNSQFSPAATLYPDNEDLNRDNTLNETEEYYEYQIDLKPGMDVGLTRYITDKRVITPNVPNGQPRPENWYLFRIPVENFTTKVGQIPDFKSIRFVRMYLTGFEDSVVTRFATLNLVRNQWRGFTYDLDTTGSYTPIATNTATTLDVLAVNVEENSSRQPIPYVIPPGIERVQVLSNNGVNLLQNEQSMSLRIKNLADGDSRAVFKTMNLDFRQYGKLSMFIHAEASGTQLRDNDLNAVIRIGQDFLNNYYEIKIPLKVTVPGNALTADQVWPADNNLDFSLQQLVNLKLTRNESGAAVSQIYRQIIGNRTYSIMGNPNLGQVTSFLIGVENPKDQSGMPLNTEVWVNELRLSEIDEQGGWAALGRVDAQLADLGTVSVSANTYTAGFGSIDQRVTERAMNDMFQFDAATQLDLGKLVPRKAGFSIPVYASINRTVSTPKYDPYNLDVKLKTELGRVRDKHVRDSIKSTAQDITTIKTLNFTNVRFAKPTMRPKLWSLSNFDFTYSYTKFEQVNPVILKNDVTKQRFGLGYTYNGQAKFITPFTKLIKNKSSWLAFLRDFNFNLNPALLGFRADVNRQFGMYIPRIVNSYDNKVERVDTTYDKYFTFDRYYNLRWDLSRSLNLDFSAINNARVDEPYGRLDTKAKRDSVWKNFFKGGRNTMYQQKGTLTYNLPLQKFPFADWIQAHYSYSTNYDWVGASLLATNLGNTIENGQQNSFTGEFDFSRLYAKSKLLRSIDMPATPKPKAPANNNPAAKPQQVNPLDTLPTREQVIKGLKGKQKREALRKWRRQRREAKRAARLMRANQPQEVNGFVRTAGGLLLMVKRVSINYTANLASRVPGYMDSTKFIGQNWHSMQPGLGYVFGKQPDTAWLNDKARRGLITRDSTFNLLYRQNFDQRLNLTASLQPIRELNIDLNIEKSYSKEYTELFKDTTGTGDHFGHLSPYASGGFTVSYISLGTLFRKYDPNQVSQTFTEFQNNRLIISQRVAAKNPYQSGNKTPDGYYEGYGRYSQDVLIPAFLAAYGKRDPNKIALIGESNGNIKSNPFSGIKPLPNWRLTYTGLSHVPALSSIFSSVTLTHGYTGSLSMNSFTSALNYYDPLHLGTPGFIDTISGNFVPFFLVPNLTVQEQFAPLIGIDVTTLNMLNVKFEFLKSRQLSLSLSDYQLSEVRSTEWHMGLSWRKRGLNLPFSLPGMKKGAKKLQNDLNFTIDLGVRDDTQSNSRLDQATAYATGGQKVVKIQPSIDYVLNNRINIKLFFDQQKTIPYISSTAPVTNTRAGVQVRISLAP
ncbi:T9SS outer membrane translocon Sov/SprA [Deminuibacter soli]|uniref:Cell surface protein SprA n=1 Tax=Deminuibacter soli TaxID=2291815 RepID=A0A3E1NCZ9_9BACT|nr:cell surface protein SprA [Deminuibacter soli]RFM25694.1 cell surface protein SprA [Deminuibacter soli]